MKSKGKIAILGDIHISARNDSEHFIQYQKKFFEYFFEYVKTNKIKNIVQLGDFQDRRRYLNINTWYHAKKNIIEPLSKYNTIVISGNHDTYYKSTNEVNSVSLMLEGSAKVIDTRPETVSFGDVTVDFYPWISPENIDDSLKFLQNSKSDYAMGHFEFNKFELHPGQMAESGMDHTMFAKYKRVYSGHYHTQSFKDNVLYTGVPYELDWSDCDDPKGFWVHDLDTGDVEFIRTPFNLYKKIRYVDNTILPENITGMYVKMFVEQKSDQYSFDKYVDQVIQLNPYDLKIIDNTIKDDNPIDTDQSIEGMNTIDIMNSYIDKLDIGIDKERLKSKVRSLYTESIQAE